MRPRRTIQTKRHADHSDWRKFAGARLRFHRDAADHPSVILSVLAKDLARQVEVRSFASTLRMTDVEAAAVNHVGVPPPIIAAHIRTTCTIGSTSWTRTIDAPLAMLHATVAAVPNSRSSGSVTPVTWPMNRLRLVPITSGR